MIDTSLGLGSDDVVVAHDVHRQLVRCVARFFLDRLESVSVSGPSEDKTEIKTNVANAV